MNRANTNFFLFSINLNMGITKHIKAELCTVKAMVAAIKYLTYCLLSIYLKAKKIMDTAIYCLTVLNEVKYMKDKYIRNAKIIFTLSLKCHNPAKEKPIVIADAVIKTPL